MRPATGLGADAVQAVRAPEAAAEDDLREIIELLDKEEGIEKRIWRVTIPQTATRFSP